MNELDMNSTDLTAEEVVVHVVQLDYGMNVSLSAELEIHCLLVS